MGAAKSVPDVFVKIAARPMVGIVIGMVAPGYKIRCGIEVAILGFRACKASDILIVADIHILVVRGILACKIPPRVHVFFTHQKRMGGAIANIHQSDETAAINNARACVPRCKHIARRRFFVRIRPIVRKSMCAGW